MLLRVLVTGGAGYVGSHISKALCQAGHGPVAYDNLSLGHRWAVRWGPLVEADLYDTVALCAALRQYRIEAVIHCAGSAYVGESMQHPEKYFENNVSNSLRLLAAMRQEGVGHLVFSSSCTTYGVPRSVPIRDDHPQCPVSPYGESKLFVERALHWYGEAYGLRWAALRYFNAAGADPDGQIGEAHDPETHLIPRVLLAALGQAPLEIFGTDYPTPDGTAVRDYVHVTDLASAHVSALSYLEEGGASTVLNLGAGKGSSVREVIRQAEQISGLPVPVRESARRAGDPALLVADATRAATALNWTPRHSNLETILATAWSWHRTNSLNQTRA